MVEIRFLMNMIGLDENVVKQVVSMPECSSELKDLFYKDEQAFLAMLKSLPEWRKTALKLYLELAVDAYKDYKNYDIDDQIYFDTMRDITIWTKDCYRKYGEYGLEETFWLAKHLKLKLFCLGRLQFEPIYLEEDLDCGDFCYPKGTYALNVHIPEGDSLLLADCINSFRMADDFFGSGADLFVCDSWLLSPELKRFLPQSSNIIRFQEMFRLVKVHHRFEQAEERIFKNILKDKTKYPEDTALRRNIKPYFVEGNDPGIGIGIIKRIRCMPFMSELKCVMCGVTCYDYSRDPEIMALTEIRTYRRFCCDRIVIGPNTRGISESLGAVFIYPDGGVPYIETPPITSIEQIWDLKPVQWRCGTDKTNIYGTAAGILNQRLPQWIRKEMSIGGPFTIASMLLGAERLLRDCRKESEAIKYLLRIITDTQKSCIDMAADYGFGIAMADPVANPELIGPKMYEEFVFPYTVELTEYAEKTTGKKVSLHMCGNTYSIWKFFIRYQIAELSLDNIIDMDLAASELGPYVRIAGNVDPVGVIMNGDHKDICAAVQRCIRSGSKAENGFTLATGCDIPETTDPVKIDWFMKAAREASTYYI